MVCMFPKYFCFMSWDCCYRRNWKYFLLKSTPVNYLSFNTTCDVLCFRAKSFMIRPNLSPSRMASLCRAAPAVWDPVALPVQSRTAPDQLSAAMWRQPSVTSMWSAATWRMSPLTLTSEAGVMTMTVSSSPPVPRQAAPAICPPVAGVAPGAWPDLLLGPQPAARPAG